MTRNFEGIGQVSVRILPLVISTLVILAGIGVAQAQDFCADIGTLIDQSRSEFAEIAGEATGTAGDQNVTLTLAAASYCALTKRSKTTGYHCEWEFPYRAEDAYDTFHGFVGEMNECIGQQATLHDDQSVNHPDFYALRRYEMEQAEVSVSVKDKSALGNTFVFIRVQGRKR